MATRTTRRGRFAAGVFAGALLMAPLTACGDAAESEGADASPDVTVTESPPAEETGADPTEEQGATGTTGPSEQTDGTEADVECSGTSCSVTLSGDGADAEILGTSVVFGGVENGRATFRVGNQEISCGQGESVSAGPLTLSCSTVTDTSVTMTASLG